MYWTSTVSVVVVLSAAMAACWWASVKRKWMRIQGLASRAEVSKVAGAGAPR